MDQLGTILLTSTGLSSKDVYSKFTEIMTLKNHRKAVIITTASRDKEKNQYSQMAFSQLMSVGLDIVDFYDFEEDGQRNLSSYDVIYVCGGNTFKLMKFARKMNFDKDIKSLLRRGGMYVGVSAGSLIIGPSIQIANEIEPDINDVGLNDFSGFNIIDLIIYPHYSPEIEEEIKLFENKNKVSIERINNSQAILITDGKKILI